MLTGKDVYLTEKVALGLRSDWEQLSSFIQGQYETQAALINETHIAPLQGLVRDQQELLTSWKGVLQNQYGPVQMQEALTTFDELVQRALVLHGNGKQEVPNLRLLESSSSPIPMGIIRSKERSRRNDSTDKPSSRAFSNSTESLPA
jgi:hypothetical protein